MNEQMKNQRNVILDCLKGVLIILVIIRHVLQYNTANEGNIISNMIYAVQMPGFMIVSGYFSARKIKNFKECSAVLEKCVERYLMPFLTWYILIDIILLGKYNRDVLVGLSYLFGHVDSGMWFIWVIFVFSIIITFCNLCVEHGKSIPAKIMGVLIVCIICFGILLGIALKVSLMFLGIKYILYYFVFYGVGWLIRNIKGCGKLILFKLKDIGLFICLVIFLAIVYNYDLCSCDDDFISIILRCIAGFTGNTVIYTVVNKFHHVLTKVRIEEIGKYTLEIYVVHIYVDSLLTLNNRSSFFTVSGFSDFIVAFIFVIVFTTIIIVVFKSISVANFIMFGKRK